MEDHCSKQQRKRVRDTDASSPTTSKRPRPDVLEESPLLLPSSDSSEKIDVPSASEANSNPPISSNSEDGSKKNYYVFLSFRGPDTCKGFVDHLYQRLKAAGLPFHPNFVFRDDEDLAFGKKIGENLISAIERSKISIPVISENYAASKWCLRELIHIMKCKESRGQIVLPVLYKVKTEDVKHMQGKFGEAFESSMGRFDEEVKQQGPLALRKAIDLRVFESDKFADGHEGELVKELVEIILLEQQHDFQPHLPKNLVAIEDRVAEVMKLVDLACPDTRIIGIWGMGGIGKTTLATIIYKKLFDNFKCRSSLKDIREEINHKGVEHVQSLLISDITKSPFHRVRDSDRGIGMIRSSCENEKVLILLDDVGHRDHLDKLIGGCNFGLGSRIIITCRDKALLKSEYKMYELKEMNREESWLLFSRYAFKGEQPPTNLVTLSSHIVATTGGLPLALMVVGSLLEGEEDQMTWREMLEKLRNVPADDVQEKLMISYDTLKHEEKHMFLDIACFFIGTDKRIATYFWVDPKFFPRTGLQILINRSLIKIDDKNRLRMHDQLRDLGRGIACPAEKKPWEWSRLWDEGLWDEEAMRVLRRKEKNEYIEALCLNERGSREFMEQESFKRMPNLKCLRGSHADFDRDLKDSLSELRWLEWKYCPNSFKATNVHLEKLVILDLSKSLISENWGGWSSIKMEKLKVLNLSKCSHLESTPNLSAFKNLEILILEYCSALEEIDPSIGDVKCLISLNLRGCVSLEKLPEEMGQLEELKELIISDTPIEEIPQCIGSLENLLILNADQCNSLVGLPDSISNLVNLSTLDLRLCFHLDGLPESIGSLVKLQHLSVGHTCASWPYQKLNDVDYHLCHIPCSIGKLESLTELILSRAEISELPKSIGDLKNLKILNIAYRKKLSSLPNTISKLGKLEVLDASFCRSLGGEFPIDGLSSLKILRLSNTCISGFPDAFGKLSCLEELDLEDCSMIQSLPELPASLTDLVITCHLHTLPHLSHLIRLKQLSLQDCKLLESMPELPSGISMLYFSRCYKLEKLPNLSSLELLSQLCIEACQELTEIKGLEGLKTLRKLCVFGCNKLSNLDGLEHLESLRYLGLMGTDVSRRWELFKHLDLNGPIVNDDLFQGLDRLKNLEELSIYRCQSLIRPDLSQLTRLKILRAFECYNLIEIKGLERLKNLESLYIYGSISIETLPDLSCFDNLVILDIGRCRKLHDVRGLEKVRCVDRG